MGLKESFKQLSFVVLGVLCALRGEMDGLSVVAFNLLLSSPASAAKDTFILRLYPEIKSCFATDAGDKQPRQNLFNRRSGGEGRAAISHPAFCFMPAEGLIQVPLFQEGGDVPDQVFLVPGQSTPVFFQGHLVILQVRPIPGDGLVIPGQDTHVRITVVAGEDPIIQFLAGGLQVQFRLLDLLFRLVEVHDPGLDTRQLWRQI